VPWERMLDSLNLNVEPESEKIAFCKKLPAYSTVFFLNLNNCYSAAKCALNF
jgi:hypothetical protein